MAAAARTQAPQGAAAMGAQPMRRGSGSASSRSGPEYLEANPLLHLVYTSSSPDRYMTRASIEQILATSRRNNSRVGVTGECRAGVEAERIAMYARNESEVRRAVASLPRSRKRSGVSAVVSAAGLRFYATMC
jgi:hypothetical protein